MQGFAKLAGEPGSVGLIDVPRPEPGPDEALIEVAYAGLCGSDVGIYEFEAAYEGMSFPRIIGHEYAGTVVEVGANVTAVSEGDRVVERPIRACGECFQCRSGTPNICRDARITGVHHHGAFAPFIVTPAGSLNRVPDDLDLRDAAIAEPAAVAARAVIRNSRVAAGDRVLVEGPGPIGLLSATIARRQGAEVSVSGTAADADHRLALASDLGFETVNVEADDLAAVAAAATDGVGFDVVLDATGHPAGVGTAADAVRKGGQVVLVGLAGDVELDATALVRGEIDLQATYSAGWEDVERALRLLEAGAIGAERLVDGQFSLRDGAAAFEAAMAGETVKPVFDLEDLR